ncbi:DUF1643 domain-containing protein [Streptomyces sp. G-5]|uniref:DUF1643 domain-containing protein n=1 Tax=Streptomyces sp. G-5 TaxID=2977231 RepID=UPI0021D39EF5|nr:DUF1643 domain-containing protein [Streptomyces sp. G-5]MCU4750291.1 DUF1643 domain-containing protein [Streptomyces sp. G-5]
MPNIQARDVRVTTTTNLALLAAAVVGEHADALLRNVARRHRAAIVGWGAIRWDRVDTASSRAQQCAQMLDDLGLRTWCLGRTSSGAPRHPLYVPADAPLLPWPSGTGRTA